MSMTMGQENKVIQTKKKKSNIIVIIKGMKRNHILKKGTLVLQKRQKPIWLQHPNLLFF